MTTCSGADMTKLPINLTDLLRQRTVEGERIEYTTGRNPDAIIRTVCAFANDFENLGGSYVVIGQDCDAHGQPVFPPVGLADNQLDKIQQELLSLAAKVPFDDRYHQSARIDDLSQPLMQAFLQEVGSALAADAPGLSVEALARQMHVAGGPTESPWPKNVGLLFFNDAPERFFPGLQIDVVWFPEGAGGNRFEEKIFKGPLARMTREALGYIQRNFLGETVIKHPDRAEATRVWNFPYAAIEEALVNAVYHRSYEEREPIEVRISHEELVIVRFPGPDRSIRLADLQAGRSTGIPKILKAMAANGSPAPLFETDDDRLAFVIRLPRHPLSLVPSADTTQVTGEVDRLLRAVEGEMSRQQIQAALGLKSEEHFRTAYLKPALQAGVVEMTVPDKPNSRHQRYRLTPLGQRWLQTLPSPAKPTSPHP